MKKINIVKNWKSKKRYSFHFYFVLITTVVVTITECLSLLFTNIFNTYKGLPTISIIMILSIIIGIILSILFGKVILIPINNLKKLMNEVVNGNLDVKVEEKSKIDEVEDMYHYFNLMMKELKSTEIIQSDFIANVSHEFKTPLNAIDGYATLLSDKDLSDEEKEKYIEKIIYNSRRMNELIGNILLLSKIDNQSIDSKKNEYSLDEQIRQSIVFLEPKWSAKNIEFDVELENVMFYGNESIMFHVWNNLIDNAIKFSPINGVIKIRLVNKNNKIYFTIDDFGSGISDEDKKYIFNKFYQADSSHRSEGNGLGLALASKILNLVDGTIEVENLSPTGCRFIVVL